MADYIDREALFRRASTKKYQFTVTSDESPFDAVKKQGILFKKCVEEAPAADVVKVVRCKDCRHCKFNSSAEVYKCDRRGYFTETVAEDGFCSYGERKE